MAQIVGAGDFLCALFEEACGDKRLIVIWTLPDKQSRFFSRADEAAVHACSLAETHDVYFGVGLYRPGIRKGRGKATDVAAIPALWGDVDYGKHVSKIAPPTEQDARRIIAHVGVEPSILVNSGHGFHAYWLLKEPLEPADNMAGIARTWQETLAACAQYHGYTIDSVSDVSRVLRVPGTINHKDSERLPVEVRAFTTRRYDLDDLEPYYAVCPMVSRSSQTAPSCVKTIAIDAAAEPGRDLLATTLQHSAVFKRTWEQRRGPDLHDHSPSGYELSLASQAVGMGWTDQEIADLLIAWRRKHGHDSKKGTRRDYLQGTIARAKHGREEDVAASEIKEICNRKEGKGEGSIDRSGILAKLCYALRLPITRWIQHGIDKPLYSLELKDGRNIPIGRAEHVMSQRAFKTRIWEITGDPPPQIKQAQWNDVLRGLGAIREVIPNPERTLVGWGEDLIADYTRQRPVAGEDEWQKAVQTKASFCRRIEGISYLYVSLLALRQFCRVEQDDRVEVDTLTSMLRAIGFEECQVHVKKYKLNRRYWRRPAPVEDGQLPKATPLYGAENIRRDE